MPSSLLILMQGTPNSSELEISKIHPILKQFRILAIHDSELNDMCFIQGT